MRGGWDMRSAPSAARGLAGMDRMVGAAGAGRAAPFNSDCAAVRRASGRPRRRCRRGARRCAARSSGRCRATPRPPGGAGRAGTAARLRPGRSQRRCPGLQQRCLVVVEVRDGDRKRLVPVAGCIGDGRHGPGIAVAQFPAEAGGGRRRQHHRGCRGGRLLRGMACGAGSVRGRVQRDAGTSSAVDLVGQVLPGTEHTRTSATHAICQLPAAERLRRSRRRQGHRRTPNCRTRRSPRERWRHAGRPGMRSAQSVGHVVLHRGCRDASSPGSAEGCGTAGTGALCRSTRRSSGTPATVHRMHGACPSGARITSVCDGPGPQWRKRSGMQPGSRPETVDHAREPG